jgi:hypothetical protein
VSRGTSALASLRVRALVESLGAGWDLTRSIIMVYRTDGSNRGSGR